MWQFFLESGIHATLMGVMVAAIIPTEPYLQRRDYAAAVDDLLHDYRLAMANNDQQKAQAVLGHIEMLSRGTEGPMERLERIVHPWVSFAVLPLFALANAGIVFTSDTLSDAASSLHAGRCGGAAAREPAGRAGHDVAGRAPGRGAAARIGGWRHVLGAGFLAGIGFTVAIFVSGIAFDDPAVVDQARWACSARPSSRASWVRVPAHRRPRGAGVLTSSSDQDYG